MHHDGDCSYLDLKVVILNAQIFSLMVQNGGNNNIYS